jgi:hypothetical protein
MVDATCGIALHQPQRPQHRAITPRLTAEVDLRRPLLVDRDGLDLCPPHPAGQARY